MNWFRRRKQLPIPKFKVQTPPDARLPPEPEPMEVNEVLDPSDSLVMRFKDLIKKRLKPPE